LGKCSSPVKLKTQSGEVVTVYFKLEGKKIREVYLEGTAKIVCQGQIS